MTNLLSEKFSTRAKSALKEAQAVSQELRHPYIGTEHLLFGIVSEISSFASEVLLKNRLSKEALKLELLRGLTIAQNPEGKPWQPQLSQDLRSTLEKAAVIASKYEYQFIGTEHFLFGIVDEEDNQAQKIMRRLRIEPKEIRKNLLKIFENVSKFPELGSFREIHKEIDEPTLSSSSALEYFTIDLTGRAKKGLIDPLIGREKEVERLISILNRRTKNNPVLIGDPGVGKTAIVEGLALAIRNRNVPDSLLGKKVLALDLALLVAGSMFRGEFENRLKQIIEEVKESGDIILFIDELHNVVGAGSTTGSLDAANILKPSLARGELRAIGATTLQEYKKYIEPDAALERRFQPIIIKEPTEYEALEILKGLRPYYEAHHEVEITEDSLEAAVKLSTRYITDRFLPDKAIDLVDETAAYHKITAAGNKEGTSFKKVERDMADLFDQKRQAVFSRDFKTAKILRQKENELIYFKEKMLQSLQTQKNYTLKITSTHIAETVARITGIPLQTLLRKEAQKLLNLEKRLQKQIVSQTHVLKEIASAVRRARAGLAPQNRPLATFMFLGPSGVGKTLVGKLLAKEVFESEQALLRIDMSEMMERHNVARLIGAPAGYIGYEEGGRLTESVKRRPYAVILFDEIEKAHPDVLNILLQILEEGELTDAAGKKISFRNTIIILTSNIGLSSLNQWAKSFGFSPERKENGPELLDEAIIKQQVQTKVREHFRPEFVNRIDKILVFHPLTKEDIQKIVKLELQKLQEQLAAQNLKLTTSSAAIKDLTAKSFDQSQGARLVRKNIQDFAEDLIAQEILHGKIKPGQEIKLDVKKGQIKLA